MCSISTFAPQRRELRRWNDVLWCLPGRHVMPLRVDMPSSVLAPHGAGIVNQMPAGSTLGSCVRGRVGAAGAPRLADTSCGGLLCSARLLVDGQKRNRRRLRDATSGPCPGGGGFGRRNAIVPPHIPAITVGLGHRQCAMRRCDCTCTAQLSLLLTTAVIDKPYHPESRNSKVKRIYSVTHRSLKQVRGTPLPSAHPPRAIPLYQGLLSPSYIFP